MRTGKLEPADAREALEEALALPRQLVPLGIDHVRGAFALRERIHVLDGLYVALADQLGCALVTTDMRLARSEAPCQILVPG